MKSCLFIIFMLSMLSGCHDGEPVASKDPKARIVELARDNNLPTLKVLIQKDTGTYTLDYQDARPDIQSVEHYGIGSTTKLLAVIVFLHYMDIYHVDLQDPIGKHGIAAESLPIISWLPSITIRQLLNHTSGIPDYTQNPAWLDAVRNGGGTPTTRQKIALIQTNKSFKLGEFRYSNSNYILIQQILEHITGRPAQQIFNEFYVAIGLPGIMLDTGDVHGQAFYADKSSTQNVTSWQEFYGFDGGAYSSADDLATLLVKVFVEGGVLSKESLDAITSWTSMQDRAIHYGVVTLDRYGLGLMVFQLGDRIFVGHPGGTVKYQSFAFVEPATGTTVVMQTNCNGQNYTKTFFFDILNEVVKLL